MTVSEYKEAAIMFVNLREIVKPKSKTAVLNPKIST